MSEGIAACRPDSRFGREAAVSRSSRATALGWLLHWEGVALSV